MCSSHQPENGADSDITDATLDERQDGDNRLLPLRSALLGMLRAHDGGYAPSPDLISAARDALSATEK